MDKTYIKVMADTGEMFDNLMDCIRSYGGKKAPGGSGTRLRRRGFITYKGHKITLVMGEVPPRGVVIGNNGNPKAAPVNDPLLVKLRERYSDSELEQIAKGEGIQKSFIPYPKITLSGHHHRIVVISDTHIGSVYSPELWHDVVASFVNDPDNKVDCVLHCGDIVDGLKIGRAGTQIYELSEIGFDAQRRKAVEMMGRYHKPIYIISGNHDMYFKEFAGANIVQNICDAVPNMTYIGHDSADIEVDGCIIRLFHGGDGSSYALSYRLQKLVESYAGGRKPNILLAGHVHKFCYILERNIHAISVPCMQMQTKYMEAKKLAAHTGFLVLDFDTENGNVCNLSVNLFPFYA